MTVIIDVAEGSAGSVAEFFIGVMVVLANCGPHTVGQLV